MYFPFNDSYFYILQVYSNMVEGEELTFKYYDSLNDNIVEYTEELTFTNNMIVGDGFTPFSLSEEYHIPETYSLSEAYPNPFNPTTSLKFAIPIDSEVYLSIYNLQGREVTKLVDRMLSRGYHTAVWNAKSHPSGIYFVKMISGDYVHTQKLMLVK